jgi:two-component system, NtrC family, sensor histidine kinase HydH
MAAGADELPAYFVRALAYVEWSDADAALLRACEPVLAPAFDGFAARFYALIDRDPHARRVITGGAAQVARLERTLVAWMTSGLRGPLDAAFYARRARIGERHVVIGLPQEYMFTAMNALRADYVARLFAEVDDRARLAAMVAAVDKLFDLELMIMLHHYQLDSEQRLIERETAARQEKLTAMRTLSAGLAHEVRNPLNAATLQLELLERRLRRGTADARLIESTDLIQHELGRLTRMLNDFLAFARPPELTSAPHDLAALVRGVVELERAGAAAAGVTLALSTPAAPARARVDPDRFHQIALNLVRNAIEATPAGGRVDVEVEATEHGAELRVRDTGCGIPPEVVQRIYEPFFSTKPAGTGLGMAIVASLVAVHDGTIDVDTAVGRGTTITVRLPLAAA